VLGRELRAVVEGSQSRDRAAARYAEFNDSHEWKFRWMLRAQRLIPRMPARLQRLVIRLCGNKRFVDWSFGHYLRIAPPDFAPLPTDPRPPSTDGEKVAVERKPDADRPANGDRGLIRAD
jgi:hypothetical protein